MYINQRKAGVILSYAGQFTKILISIIYNSIMLRLLGRVNMVFISWFIPWSLI